MRFETSTLQRDLCDYSDAYIVVKENVTVQTKKIEPLMDIMEV